METQDMNRRLPGTCGNELRYWPKDKLREFFNYYGPEKNLEFIRWVYKRIWTSEDFALVSIKKEVTNGLRNFGIVTLYDYARWYDAYNGLFIEPEEVETQVDSLEKDNPFSYLYKPHDCIQEILEAPVPSIDEKEEQPAIKEEKKVKKGPKKASSKYSKDNVFSKLSEHVAEAFHRKNESDEVEETNDEELLEQIWNGAVEESREAGKTYISNRRLNNEPWTDTTEEDIKSFEEQIRKWEEENGEDDDYRIDDDLDFYEDNTVKITGKNI